MRSTGSLLVLLTAMFSSNGVIAGPLSLVTPGGGTVQIGAQYRDGSTAVATIIDNGAGDENPQLGKVTFTIPDEPDVVTSTIANIGVGGKLANLEADDWGTAGMFSFEPVDIPTYNSPSDVEPLVTTVDVASGDTTTQYIYSGNDFHISSFFDVFLELSLDPGSFGDPTGTVESGPSAEFRRAPEPASLLLLGFGLAALAGMRRWAGD